MKDLHRKASLALSVIVVIALYTISTAITATSAHATLLTANLAWSGAIHGNTAVATGVAVIDDTLLPNPGRASINMPGMGLVSFSITVSGASDDDANNTWVAGDFSNIIWDTGEAKLNLYEPLIGQPTPSGFPWGETGHSGDISNGDFTLENVAQYAPTLGNSPFQLITNNGFGEAMDLTKFTVVVPETSTLALILPELGMIGAGMIGAGMIGAGMIRRRNTNYPR